jgi:hypothetical protein
MHSFGRLQEGHPHRLRSTRSSASCVNPSGAVVGSYTDSGGVGHGYLLYHKTFATIDFPGAIFMFAGANNPERCARIYPHTVANKNGLTPVAVRNGPYPNVPSGIGVRALLLPVGQGTGLFVRFVRHSSRMQI